MTNPSQDIEMRLSAHRPVAPSAGLWERIVSSATMSGSAKFPAPTTQLHQGTLAPTVLLTGVILLLIAMICFSAIRDNGDSGEPSRTTSNSHPDIQQRASNDRVQRRKPEDPNRTVEANPQVGSLELIAELRPDPLQGRNFKIIACGRIASISKDGAMVIQIEKFLKRESNSKKADLPSTSAPAPSLKLSQKKWSWLKVCQRDDLVFLYWGTNPTVDLLIRTEPTGKDGVLRFHTAGWEFFRGSTKEFTAKVLAD